MEMFDVHRMGMSEVSCCRNILIFHVAEFIPESKAHIFNAGAPVWGVDWCPIHPNDRIRQLLSISSNLTLSYNIFSSTERLYKQYLAVAPFSSSAFSPEIGCKVVRPSKACIQIWTLSPTRPVLGLGTPNGKDRDFNQEQHPGKMKCEMVLCLEGGPAHDIRWCPLPSHDVVSTEKYRVRDTIDSQQDISISEPATTAKIGYPCRNIFRWFTVHLCSSRSRGHHSY